MKMPKLNITKKETKHDIRYFLETDDGFDGTANGYGFKTKDAVYRAYYYFLNKSQNKHGIGDWLKNNPDVKSICDEYFDREPTSIEHLIMVSKEDQPEVVDKLLNNTELWQELLQHYLH